MMCLVFVYKYALQKTAGHFMRQHFIPLVEFHLTEILGQISLQIIFDYLLASSTATATATVIPTMGLLPAPMRPIISVRQ